MILALVGVAACAESLATPDGIIHEGDFVEQVLPKLECCPELALKPGFDGAYTTTREIYGVKYDLTFEWFEDPSGRLGPRYWLKEIDRTNWSPWAKVFVATPLVLLVGLYFAVWINGRLRPGKPLFRYSAVAAKRRAQASAVRARLEETVRAVADSASEDSIDESDYLLLRAAELCIHTGSGSTTLLQTRLEIGYFRAVRLIELLEKAGVLGPRVGTKPRQALIKSSEWPLTSPSETNAKASSHVPRQAQS